MKRLLMSGAFSVMLLSPAFAQSYDPGYGTGNVIDLPALEHGGVATGSASRSFASEPRQTKQSRHSRAQALSPSDADTVYEDGQISVGTRIQTFGSNCAATGHTTKSVNWHCKQTPAAAGVCS